MPLDTEPETVNIDYPKEMPLEALVEYVAQALDLRVIYGDELRNQRQTCTTVFAASTNGASLWRFCGGQECMATAFECNVKELTAS